MSKQKITLKALGCLKYSYDLDFVSVGFQITT